jgi:hypothetical protein
VALALMLASLRSPAAEGMNGPRSGGHATGDLRARRDEILLPRTDVDLFPVEREDVRALDEREPLVELVDVLIGDGIVLDGSKVIWLPSAPSKT